MIPWEIRACLGLIILVLVLAFQLQSRYEEGSLKIPAWCKRLYRWQRNEATAMIDRFDAHDGPKTITSDPDFGWICTLGFTVKSGKKATDREVYGVGKDQEEAVASAVTQMDDIKRGKKK